MMSYVSVSSLSVPSNVTIDVMDQSNDGCEHDEYEADIMTGMATCLVCGDRWLLTPEQLERIARDVLGQ